MTEEKESGKFIEKFIDFASALGNQIYLRSLRDAFATIMPVFIVAGIAVLINNIIFPLFLSGDALLSAQVWGNLLTNGTLSISGLLIAAAIGYRLARNMDYENPFMGAVISVSVLIIMMPTVISATPFGATDSDAVVKVTGALAYSNLGTSGMFAGIIIGLLATDIFIRLTKIEKLKIKMPEMVPPAVADSFNALIPVIIIFCIFGALAAMLNVFAATDLVNLIKYWIAEPLKSVNASLPGVCLLYTLGNLLFCFGIHQSVITGSLLDPFMIANINENMLAFANHQAIPNILCSPLVNNFGLIGGSGDTLCLIIATFIFSKYKASRSISELSLAPGLFNINEPVIFGYPIVFNIALIIPFVLMPTLGIIIGYYTTLWGWMNPSIVFTPWTTPPLLAPYLATGGDWRAVVIQLFVIILGVFVYLPFMKLSERIQMRSAGIEEKEEAAETGEAGKAAAE